MPIKCECGKEHDAIETAEHKRRLDAKEGANKTLREELAAAQAKAKDAEEVGALRTKLAEMTEAGTRAAAFDELGIAPAVRKRFETIFASDTADLEERPAFADWLKADATKADPLLGPSYGKGAAAGEATTKKADATTGADKANAGTQARQPATATTGSTEAGAGAAGKDSIKTAADLDAYLRSPAYRNLPVADQRKVDAELAGKLGVELR